MRSKFYIPEKLHSNFYNRKQVAIEIIGRMFNNDMLYQDLEFGFDSWLTRNQHIDSDVVLEIWNGLKTSAYKDHTQLTKGTVQAYDDIEKVIIDLIHTERRNWDITPDIYFEVISQDSPQYFI